MEGHEKQVHKSLVSSTSACLLDLIPLGGTCLPERPVIRIRRVHTGDGVEIDRAMSLQEVFPVFVEETSSISAIDDGAILLQALGF